jgi:hypothetical protein
MLAEQLGRLCGEIAALRCERQGFRKDLKQETRERATAVGIMRASLFRARAEMARKMKADLTAFTTRLRKEAGERGRGVRTDIAGARHAWCGRRAFRAAG